MERWFGRVALITGASSVGIGADIAERLVQHGMKVVGCSRNIQKIEEMAERLKDEKGKLLPVSCDVRKEDQINGMFQKAKEEFGGVDVLINSAGVGHPAPLLSGETEDWRDVMEVNVLGLCACTREAYKSMQERGVDDGHIIHINSLAGHRVLPKPHSNIYAASKYAVTALTEGLRAELRIAKSNIRVTQISPGYVKTELNMRKNRKTKEESDEFYKTTPHLDTKDTSDAIIYALSAPPHVQVHDVIFRNTQSYPLQHY